MHYQSCQISSYDLSSPTNEIVTISGHIVCATTVTVLLVLRHHMSLTCCGKSHHTPATLAPAHTPATLDPAHTRNTRSSSCTMPLLNRPAHSKATLGDHSFCFASSSVWNSIPNDVWYAPSLSSCKSCLKTYLFHSVYKG